MNSLDLQENLSRFCYILGEADTVCIKRVTAVLKCVLDKIDFGDLRQARLVCRSWDDVVCHYTNYWDLSVMVLRGEPDLTLTFLRDREVKRWKNFKFLTPLFDNSTQIQSSFWIALGHNISSLILQSHSLSPVEFLSVLSSCPNLRSLTFSCRPTWLPDDQNTTCHVRLVDHIGYFQQQRFLSKLSTLKILNANLLPQGVLRDLLLLTSEIQNLCLHDTSELPVPHWDVGDVIRYVATRPKHFKRLELTGSNIYPEYITALSSVNDLNLTSLHLRYAKLTDTSFLALFKVQRSLTEIDLSFTPCSQRAFLHQQCTFAALKVLRLRGFSSNITSFAFLARMPNLEDLDLSATFSTTMNWEPLIDSLLPLRLQHLKSLNLSLNMGLGIFPRSKLFTSLVSTLNHITCLNLSQNTFVKDSIVHDIWRHLSHLRVVFLESLCSMSTEGITGIRHAQMQNLLANGTLGRIDPKLLRQQNSGGSYIGLCQGIQVLSLAYNSRLNDFVIPFGITDLENLQKLKLTSCSQISEKYLVDLITYCTRLEYLDLTGTQIQANWADWAKAANPRLRRIIVSNYGMSPIAHFPVIVDGHHNPNLSRIPGFSCEEPTNNEPVMKFILEKQFDASDTEAPHTACSRGDFPSLPVVNRPDFSKN